jgi:hypothetical protein
MRAMQRQTSSKPSFAAVFGTYYGKPEISVRVTDGNDKSFVVVWGDSTRSDVSFTYGRAMPLRKRLLCDDFSIYVHIDANRADTYISQDYGANELAAMIGLKPWSGMEDEFAKTWNRAVRQYSHFLKGDAK